MTDNSSVNESNTKVRSDVTLPIAVQDAIDSEPALQGLWGMETPLAGQQDETASGYGYFLICQLSLRKHNRQACVDTLVVFRQMHQAVHRDAAWFLREVDRAFAWVESNQAKKTFGSTEGILRIAFDHWRSHVQLNSPLLTIDWVLFTSMACNSYDGEHARISNQSLADMAGCSSRYISKRLSRIVELGCLIEVEKSTRVSPRKFRMNFAHSIANGMNTSSNHSVLLGDV